MIKGKGKSVFSSIAIGKIFVFEKADLSYSLEGECSENELEKLNAAIDKARADLSALYEKTLKELGQEQADIIDVQSMFLEDPDFTEGIEAEINSGLSAPAAVKKVGDEMAESFASLDDDYMKARALDVRDISDRLVRTLLGADKGNQIEEPSILVSDDLTPSETISLDKSKILAIVIKNGSSNSHTAILARAMGIPALVQADIDITCTLSGKMMIVDGFDSTYVIDPDESEIKKAEKKKEDEERNKRELEQYRGKSAVTKSGKKIRVFANIGSSDDALLAVKNDADGVGLMRSEFLYLGRDSFPTEDELFEQYRKAVEALEGRLCVIRTLDIGADKKVDYFNLEEEENPALGYRGIRICIRQKDIFRTQLRAIYRASAYGKVAIMFPMIISKEEVLEIKDFLTVVEKELEDDGIAFDKNIEKGIMIETPAAAVIADELAPLVDFFSVGTNDLSQYTLAIDRQNEKLDYFFNAHHEAILRLMENVAREAVKNNIWAGICGELGSDLTLTDRFIKMGYTELSVSPAKVLSVKKNVINSEV
ncbi:MAG TPA: phosphoenolpyruvate--protein phosphotransferase [Candidatus Ornithospirochaeta avicola]|uniref:Phosphoenolpyruvate-protein phosphotransferase n=1 Tax=Candidatus Ornithospirochaeta avicola TaxID=2840896 RepID=A0A9D1PVI8_9SPIO|nr:phosphoenolpyruvate--protein phosphotransferase [Candidatus Ornithospirochaeta avicola]